MTSKRKVTFYTNDDYEFALHILKHDKRVKMEDYMPHKERSIIINERVEPILKQCIVNTFHSKPI